MKKLRVLLAGQNAVLLRALPFLFFRAGFEIDLLTCFWAHNSRYFSSYISATNRSDFLQKLFQINPQNYDLIVIFDDQTLFDIANSNLSEEHKLHLLPVLDKKHLRHIYSKIALSQILAENKINTPDFFVGKNFDEIEKSAASLGYPLLVKVDNSSGGAGVFECKNFTEICALDRQIFATPFLLQKKIIGDELDLSALYLKGKLISFTYSKFEKTIKKFGPSSLRSYQQLSEVSPDLFKQMQKLGEVLGADGFTNISVIKSKSEDKIYFFEADMRPNVWVDYGRFFGEDLAPRISKWFSDKQELQFPQKLNHNSSEKILIPFCFRMKFWELLINRYGVWRYISLEDFRWFMDKSSQSFFAKDFRKVRKFFTRINRIPTLTIRLFLPQKNDRKRIKYFFAKLCDLPRMFALRLVRRS